MITPNSKGPIPVNYIFFASVLFLICCAVSCKKPDITKIRKNIWYMSHDVNVALCFENTTGSITGKYIKTDKAIAENALFTAVLKGSKIEFSFSKDKSLVLSGKLRITEEGFEIKQKKGKYAQFKPEPQFIMPSPPYRYSDKISDAVDVKEVQYGAAEGYYASKLVESVSADKYPLILLDVLVSVLKDKEEIPLTMDIYTPGGDTLKNRPLVLLIHGGAFVVGDKRDVLQVRLARYFALRGFVVASVNYRMGYLFWPGVYSKLERCMYKALQDVRAALRYLASHKLEYGINTEYFFISGNSAGGFLSLFSAFMDEDEKWESTGENLLLLHDDLGCLDCSTNNETGEYKPAGVVSLWGGLTSPNLIDAGDKCPVLLIHGDSDRIVPYGYDYPFKNLDPRFTSFFLEKVYGSEPIFNKMQALGFDAELNTITGGGHEPQLNDDLSYNQSYTLLRDKMKSFFFKILQKTPLQLKQWGRISNESPPVIYTVNNADNFKLTWKCTGGIILRHYNNGVQIVWLKGAPQHQLDVAGINEMGVVKESYLKTEINKRYEKDHLTENSLKKSL